MIRVGPAGWSYPDWEGRVYPRTKPRGFHPLDILPGFVDYIEINSTFYAQPRAAVTAGWARRVRAHQEFRFGAKLLRDFTHGPLPEAPQDWADKAAIWREGIAPLQREQRLSAVLVQFPVSFQEGPAGVRRLASIASLFDGMPLVVELRHSSWFDPRGLSEIAGLGYSLAHIDLPDAWNHPPRRHPVVGALGYVRLHGRNGVQWFSKEAGRDERYDYLYSPPELGELAFRIGRVAGECDETLVATNNHFEGQAVANALELRWLLGGREPVPAPAELCRAFPHLEGITLPAGQADLFE